jgi:drug/metabolite transporter (DMT)-like permease
MKIHEKNIYAGRDTRRFVKALLPNEYLYLVVISVLGFISQVTLTKGTQMVNTTTVALFRNSDILVTVCFQIFYFHILPSWLQIVGRYVLSLDHVAILV